MPRLIASAEELAARPAVEARPALPALGAAPASADANDGGRTRNGGQALVPRPAADDRQTADGRQPGAGLQSPDGLRGDAPQPGEGMQPVSAHQSAGGGDEARNGERPGAACTPAQMRRFIKSRPWVPLHELRRRFQIEGTEDDVVGIDVPTRRIFVGLPVREGQILGDLLRSGEIGYELSLDPSTPIVIGIYPMRPVVRS